MSVMSKERQKGTAWETDIVDYARPYFPHVKRTGSANFGAGDIDLAPGVVIEAKNVQRIDLAAIVDQAEAARQRVGGDIAAAWVKRRGKASPGEAYVLMTGAQFLWFLNAVIEVDEEGRP